MCAWIKGNYYLNESEMQNNALIVSSYLSSCGWSLNAIAGVLGNMQTESTINPGLWQGLTEGSGGGGGYGLVQWTPWTNFTDWADSYGYAWDDGNAQLQWINSITVSAGQWIETDSYPISFDVFKVSTETPSYLASAFLKNFERAGIEKEEQRQSQAEKWYAFILTNGDSNNVIETAIEWALSIANDDSHGYDQDDRWSPDYDCSSLVISAFDYAGLPVKINGANSTADMVNAFIASGFIEIPFTSVDELIRGDVTWRDGHTEIYLGDGQSVGALHNELGTATGGQTGDQTGEEICVINTGSNWTKVLRYYAIESPQRKKRKMNKLLMWYTVIDRGFNYGI